MGASPLLLSAGPAALAPFAAGLFLGLSMILPIGPQNIFVLSQGILGGIRRGLLAAATTGVCDTLLILTGAAGLSALLAAVPWLKAVLLALGSLFLLYLGLGSLRPRAATVPHAASVDTPSGPRASEAPVASVILTGVGVSWGNPHAILDTVAVLGSAIAAREPATRIAFATGTVAASWLFFLALALTGALFRSRVTDRTQVWVQRISGMIMLVFAIVLGWSAVVEAAALFR